MYDPQLVDNGVSALDAFERGLTAMLASGDVTVAAAGSVGSALTDVKTALQALPPAEAAAISPQLLVDINAAHSQVDSASSAITSALSSVRSSTVDAVASAEAQYLPRVHTYDRYRMAALIALFATSMSLGVLCALALLADWPGGLKPLTFLLLITLLLVWLAATALTAVLKIGTDACANLEVKTVAAVASSTGAGSQEALLVAYYLTGAGGSFDAVLGSALGLNVTSVLAQGNTTVAELDAAVQSSLTLATLLGSQAAALDAAFQGLVSAEAAMEAGMSYAAFQGPYLALKGAVCCAALDAVGAWWTALLVWGSCSGALAVAAFRWLARVADRLASRGGCCRALRPRDFSLEGCTEGLPLEPGWAPPSPEEVAIKVKSAPRRSQVTPVSPAIAAGRGPDPLGLAGGAAAAAAMAGEAFRLAGQAQEMLDGAARMMTSSRGSSPHGGAYPHVYAPVPPRSPGSPSAPNVQPPPWNDSTRL